MDCCVGRVMIMRSTRTISESSSPGQMQHQVILSPVQNSEHPSPLTLFPSSQVSGGSTTEFPQTAGGDETGGELTGGDETGGDEAAGDEAAGDETEGDETGGELTRGDETGGELTEGDETGGELTEQAC